MGNRIRRDEAVSDSVRRIVAEGLERVASRIDDPDRDHDRTIHDVRKACKRARGLLRMVRPATKPKLYARENARFRDLAREARAARDARVMLDLYDELATSAAAPRRIRDALRAHVSADAPAVDSRDVLVGLRSSIADAYDDLDGWAWEAEGFALVRRGYRDTYRRARRTLAALRESTNSERLHQWRRSVKYGLYQTEALADLWPREQRMRGKALAKLGKRLGDEHDLWELRGHLRSLDDAGVPDELFQELEARRVSLRGTCLEAGERLFADPPRAHLAHVERLWALWRRHDHLERE